MADHLLSCPGCEEPLGVVKNKRDGIDLLKEHVRACGDIDALNAWASRKLGISLN
jgi:uncharacterized protein YbaR (Trm112 family)